MARYEEIIDRAEQLASGVGVNSKPPPVFDSSITAQTVFPHAVRNVLNRLARTGEDFHDLVQTHDVSLKNGVGELPASVLKDTLEQAIFPGRPFVSYLPYHDFLRYKFLPQMDYFAINGNKLHFAENGSCDCCCGKLQLSVATAPDLPRNIDAELSLSNKVVEEVILTIASVLRGEQSIGGLAN